jgi:hypothetical protein
MASSTFLDKTADNLASLALSLVPDELVDGINPHKKVTDLNKEAHKLMLELYGVFSTNIPSPTMQAIQGIISAKYTVTVEAVLDQVLTRIKDSKEAGEKVDTVRAVKSALSGGGMPVNDTLQSAYDKANFYESIQIVFNESSLASTTKVALGEASNYVELSAVSRAIRGETTASEVYHGSYNGKDFSLGVTFTTKVNMVPVESDKLLDIIGNTKSRSMMFNYLQLKAGTISFMKGFLMNLKEIDKEVQRNVSDSLEDRILSSMSSTGGFITPKFFSTLAEARHYVICLEKSDVDTLKSQYNFDLKKPNALHLLFDRYSILSLVVVDTVGKNITFYDSDNPLRGIVYNYEKDVDPTNALSVFSKMLRG